MCVDKFSHGEPRNMEPAQKKILIRFRKSFSLLAVLIFPALLQISCGDSSQAIQQAPTAPQNLSAEAADSQVTVSWDAVIGADSYRVYWNTTGNVTTADATIDAGANTQLIHDNLTNGTTYYYRVVAVNTEGTSPVSGEVFATPQQIIVRTVNIFWNANLETAVNAAGGGYKVYYSTNSGFNITDAGVSVVDVPFVAQPSAPTNVSLQLPSGQYYFRVVAYSALTPPWGSGGSTSAPSAQISLVVP